jgi:DNA ligase (NAD+)
VCGEPVHRDEAEAVVRCVNARCPVQSERLIEHFAGRGALDIEGLGEKLAVVLHREGLVGDVSDVFTLHKKREKLIGLERMGEKSVDNLLEGIDRAGKEATLPRLFVGLGILHVGGEVAELLAGRFPSLSELRDATPEQMMEIEGVGPRIADSVAEWFERETNRQVIDRLIEYGVNPKGELLPAAGDLPFAGQRFVVTGRLETMSRPEAQARIKSLGGAVSGSVSGKTDYLVVGADPGSKLAQAEKHGVERLDEKAFLALLEQA